MTAQHDGPGSRGSPFVLVHSDPPCHSPPVGTGQEECRGGAGGRQLQPLRPASAPNTFFPWKYSDITPSYLLAGSFVNSFMPCCQGTMGPAAGWRRRRRGGGHLSWDNFFRGCKLKASMVFEFGMWVNFLGVGLCGLRRYCQGQKSKSEVHPRRRKTCLGL